ncbi:MAG: hypothetical protein M0Z78_08960 [Betaproteobacteria bacterium]|nr:hypothetical protein [Betaproteobacteria bacterium]
MNKLVQLFLLAGAFVCGCASYSHAFGNIYAGPQGPEPSVVVTGVITSGFGEPDSGAAISSAQINEAVDQAVLVTHAGGDGSFFVRGIVRYAGEKLPVVVYAIVNPSRNLVLVARCKRHTVEGMALLGRPDDDSAAANHDLMLRSDGLFSREMLNGKNSNLTMPEVFGFQIFYDFALYKITSPELSQAMLEASQSQSNCVKIYQNGQDRSGLNHPVCHWLETRQQILAKAFMYGDGLTHDRLFKPSLISVLRHLRDGYSGRTQETLSNIMSQIYSKETAELRKDAGPSVNLNSMVEIKPAGDTSLGPFKQGKLRDVIKDIDEKTVNFWLAKGGKSGLFGRYQWVDCFVGRNAGIHFFDSWSIQNQAATSRLTVSQANDNYVPRSSGILLLGELHIPAMVSAWPTCQPPELVGVPRIDYFVQGIPNDQIVQGVPPEDDCLRIKTALSIEGVPVDSETRIKKICRRNSL